MEEKIKIAYIEIDCHSEILFNFMSLMEESELFRVNYYISKEVLDELQLGFSENLICVTKGNIFTKLDKDFKLVIIGTGDKYFSVYKRIAKAYHTCAIIHNLNLAYTKNIFFNKEIKISLIHRFGLMFTKNAFLKELKRIYILDESLHRRHEFLKTRYFPLFFNSGRTEQNPRSCIKIVVPGTVEQKRRNYLRVFKKVKCFKGKMQLILLGKAKGEELTWIRKAVNEIPDNIELVYFEKHIDQNKYDQVLSDADLLWCPFQETTNYNGVIEFYGVTKISGCLGDAIRFGKPTIFPSLFQLKYDFVFQEEDDLENQIQKILKMSFNFENFKKNSVLKKLENELLQCIK